MKKEVEQREKESDWAYNEASKTANQMRGLVEQQSLDEQVAEKRAEAAENKQIAAMHAARKQAAREREAKSVQDHADYEMNSERLMELITSLGAMDGS